MWGLRFCYGFTGPKKFLGLSRNRRQGQVVWNPVNASPGLKYNLFCMQIMSFTAFVLCILRTLKLLKVTQNRRPNNINGKPDHKVTKVKSKFSLILGSRAMLLGLAKSIYYIFLFTIIFVIYSHHHHHHHSSAVNAVVVINPNGDVGIPLIHVVQQMPPNFWRVLEKYKKSENYAVNYSTNSKIHAKSV